MVLHHSATFLFLLKARFLAFISVPSVYLPYIRWLPLFFSTLTWSDLHLSLILKHMVFLRKQMILSHRHIAEPHIFPITQSQFTKTMKNIIRLKAVLMYYWPIAQISLTMKHIHPLINQFLQHYSTTNFQFKENICPGFSKQTSNIYPFICQHPSDVYSTGTGPQCQCQSWRQFNLIPSACKRSTPCHSSQSMCLSRCFP